MALGDENRSDRDHSGIFVGSVGVGAEKDIAAPFASSKEVQDDPSLEYVSMEDAMAKIIASIPIRWTLECPRLGGLVFVYGPCSHIVPTLMLQ